ncbi:hypothetical protein REPUB_Repub08aG0225900 [Reevesia pubescens]
MHEGKSYPYVFEVHGKIYVLDGYRNIDIGRKIIEKDIKAKRKLSFKVFDPKVGEWTVLPEYGYINFLNSLIKGHDILGDRIFFWYQSINSDFRLSSLDVKNRKWFYEKRDDRDRKRDRWGTRKNKDQDRWSYYRLSYL